MCVVHESINIAPVLLSGFGDSGRFYYKKHYDVLTRLAYCQCVMRQVFMDMLTVYGWRDITLIVDRSDVSARVLGESLDEGFHNGGIFPNIVTYYSDEKYDCAAMLRDASSKSRGQFNYPNLCSERCVIATLWICPKEFRRRVKQFIIYNVCYSLYFCNPYFLYHYAIIAFDTNAWINACRFHMSLNSPGKVRFHLEQIVT